MVIYKCFVRPAGYRLAILVRFEKTLTCLMVGWFGVTGRGGKR